MTDISTGTIILLFFCEFKMNCMHVDVRNSHQHFLTMYMCNFIMRVGSVFPFKDFVLFKLLTPGQLGQKPNH